MARDVKKFYDFIGKGDRKEADFYPTPDWMADALFDNVPADMFNGAKLECAWFVRDKLHAGGTVIAWNKDRKEKTPDLFLAV